MDVQVPAEETGGSPAPGELVLVQAFLNTKDVESGRDEIADPDALRAWLATHFREDARVTEGDHRRALVVREAIRDLASAHHDEELAAAAARELNRVAADIRLRVRFDPEGRTALDPAQAGVDAALGRLLGIIHTAMAEGAWERFKACARHTCRWIYYDRSKNRSRTWCSMEVCGNREKARAYRRRHADDPA